MISKFKEKEKAIKLRRQGKSYSEILKKIPVAKSTLSLWLREVGLSKKQKQRLTEKKRAAAIRGAMAKKQQRLIITQKIKNKARSEIKNISKRELWLIGIALYWAEGYKEKNGRSSLVVLGNSDANMIKIFLKWLQDICKVGRKDIGFRILLHENAVDKLLEVQKYWADATGFSKKEFQKVTWKKHKVRTNRENVGKDYYGLLAVTVKRSINFNRKIDGWIEGICKNCRIV